MTEALRAYEAQRLGECELMPSEDQFTVSQKREPSLSACPMGIRPGC